MENIVITGASRGIGKAIAYKFAQVYPSASIIAIAHNPKNLSIFEKEFSEQFSNPIETIICDLSLRERRRELVEKLSSLDVSMLVNNAGLMLQGPIISQDLHSIQKLVSVNVDAIVDLSYWGMHNIKSGGAIINVASIASFFPAPNIAAYGASKSFVLTFTESLAFERPDLKISAFCPGLVLTEMNYPEGLTRREREEVKKQGFGEVYTPEEVVELFFQKRGKKSVYIPGAKNRIAANLMTKLPKRLQQAIIKMKYCE